MQKIMSHAVVADVDCVDLTELDSKVLRGLFNQLKQVEDNVNILSDRAVARNKGQPLHLDNLSSNEVDVPASVSNWRETCVQLYLEESLDPKMMKRRLGDVAALLSEKEILEFLVQHFWNYDEMETKRMVSLWPLAIYCFVTRASVRKIEERLCSCGAPTFRQLIRDTKLPPCSIQFMLLLLHLSCSKSPLYAHYKAEAELKEDVELFGLIEPLAEELENWAELASNEAKKQCATIHKAEFDESLAKLKETEKELDAMLLELQPLKSEIESKFLEAEAKIAEEAEANVVVVDQSTPPVRCLTPSKDRPQPLKLEQPAAVKKSEQTADSSSVKRKISTVPPTDCDKSQQPQHYSGYDKAQWPVLRRGERCFVALDESQPYRPATFLGHLKNSNSTRKMVQVELDVGVNLQQCDVDEKNVAFAKTLSVQIEEGVRVVAPCSSQPSSSSGRGGGSANPVYRSGTIGQRPSAANGNEFLIFFDNGAAAYIRPSLVFLKLVQMSVVKDGVDLIVPRLGYRLLPTSAAGDGRVAATRRFLELYMAKYPEWKLVICRKPGEMIAVRLADSNQIVQARVTAFDRQLMLLRYADDRAEWLYRGSLRLPTLHNVEAQEFAATPATTTHKNRAFRRTLTQRRGVELASDDGRVKQMARKSTGGRRNDSYTGDGKGGADVTKRQRQIRHYMCVRESGFYRNMIVVKEVLSELEPRTMELKSHRCGLQCLKSAKSDLSDYKGKNPLIIPLLEGWLRHTFNCEKYNVAENGGKISRRPWGDIVRVVYVAPCGRRLTNASQAGRYLNLVKSELLSVDMFCFDVNIDPLRVIRPLSSPILSDYSAGREAVSIPVFNMVDNEQPPEIDYTPLRYVHSQVELDLNLESQQFCSGCDCVDDCSDWRKCQCQQLTREAISRLASSIRPDGKGYRFGRLLVDNHLYTGIYECNRWCRCSASRCFNRIVQKPRRVPLQLFKTEEKGWGVRAACDIPAGQFICIYAGALLTDQVADQLGLESGDEYFADLDLIATVLDEKANIGIGAADYDPIGVDFYSDDEEEDEEEDEERDEREKNTRKRVAESQPEEEQGYVSGEEVEANSAGSVWSASAANRRSAGGSSSVDEQRPVTASEKLETQLALIAGRSTSNSSADSSSSGRKNSNSSKPAAQQQQQQHQQSMFSIKEYFGDDFLFAVDTKQKGNIGRFLNHSCDPNVIVQHVLIDTHDLRLPWVAFFASENISAGDELCWDYKYIIGSVQGRNVDCKCYSGKCRGRLL